MAIVGSTERIGNRDVTILVEVDDPPRGATAADWGATRSDRVKKVIDSTRDAFGDGLALAHDCAVKAAATFDQAMAADYRPDEFELQLAVSLQAEAGAVLTKLGAEAQMQVTMRWDRPRDQ